MGTKHKPPFDRSYWVIPGKFLAGYYPGDQQRELMEPDERDHAGLPFADYLPVIQRIDNDSLPVTCHRLPIRDLGIPAREFMAQILDRIDGALGQDRPVYIHCWGGRGRTGTVVGCWLARHGIAEGEGALKKINELRCTDAKAHWPSPETSEQIRMVLGWKKGT